MNTSVNILFVIYFLEYFDELETYGDGSTDDDFIAVSDLNRAYRKVFEKQGGFTLKHGEPFRREMRRRYQVDENGNLTHEEAKELVFCIASYLDKDRKQSFQPMPDVVQHSNSQSWKSNSFASLSANDYFKCISYGDHTEASRKLYTKMIFGFYNTLFKGITVYKNGKVMAMEIAQIYTNKGLLQEMNQSKNYKIRFNHRWIHLKVRAKICFGLKLCSQKLI